MPNPFVFPPFGDLMSPYLWDKLLFDERPLAANPFFHSADNLDYWGPELVSPPQFTYPGGTPILEPPFK